jgi:ribonuclease E
VAAIAAAFAALRMRGRSPAGTPALAAATADDRASVPPGVRMFDLTNPRAPTEIPAAGSDQPYPDPTYPDQPYPDQPYRGLHRGSTAVEAIDDEDDEEDEDDEDDEDDELDELDELDVVDEVDDDQDDVDAEDEDEDVRAVTERPDQPGRDDAAGERDVPDDAGAQAGDDEEAGPVKEAG